MNTENFPILRSKMTIFEKNSIVSVQISLTALKFAGFWEPSELSHREKTAYRFYAAISFMFLLGTYLVIQVVDMYQIWGDLPAMTGNAFVLLTNLAQTAKIFNLIYKRKEVKAIIEQSDKTLRSATDGEQKLAVKLCGHETARDQLIYFTLTTVTVFGWASSAEDRNLPLRAWYPYDTTASPAYELTYIHQVVAIFIAAYLNVAKDTLVASLVAQTRCRLMLLKLALRNITAILEPCSRNELQVSLLDAAADAEARRRLRDCAVAHQAALASAAQIEQCFSKPTFAQFTVSLIIICVTAFEMATLSGNPVRVISMGTYLLNMMFQVFLYCRHGNNLREESIEVVRAAYECAWYRCSQEFRSSLLLLTRRCFKPVVLTAGGFAALSIPTFMALIKASYSFFTVLQQVQEKI